MDNCDPNFEDVLAVMGGRVSTGNSVPMQYAVPYLCTFH